MDDCPVPALQAALTAPPLGVATPAMRGPDWNGATPFSEPLTVPLTIPPTISDSALSGKASIPDKPEPEQEALSAATRPITDSIQSRYGEETRVVVSMERRGAIKLLGTFDDYGEDHAAVTERIGEMLGDVFADLELS